MSASSAAVQRSLKLRWRDPSDMQDFDILVDSNNAFVRWTMILLLDPSSVERFDLSVSELALFPHSIDPNGHEIEYVQVA